MVRALISIALLAASTAGAIDIDPAKVVDLTYPFDAQTIYWPTAKHFTLDEVQRGDTPAGYWYEANNFCAAEHGGTHMDAPVHFAKGGASADQVPVTAGIGPLARIDVSAQAARDADTASIDYGPSTGSSSTASSTAPANPDSTPAARAVPCAPSRSCPDAKS